MHNSSNFTSMFSQKKIYIKIKKDLKKENRLQVRENIYITGILFRVKIRNLCIKSS